MSESNTVRLYAERITFPKKLSSRSEIEKTLYGPVKMLVNVLRGVFLMVSALLSVWACHILRLFPGGAAVAAALPVVIATLFSMSLAFVTIRFEGLIVNTLVDHYLSGRPGEDTGCLESVILVSLGKSDVVYVPAWEKCRYLDSEHALVVASYAALYFDEDTYKKARGFQGKDILVSCGEKQVGKLPD